MLTNWKFSAFCSLVAGSIRPRVEHKATGSSVGREGSGEAIPIMTLKGNNIESFRLLCIHQHE